MSGPRRNRTVNLTIKSRLLCQLSYRPRYFSRYVTLDALRSPLIKRQSVSCVACSVDPVIRVPGSPNTARNSRYFSRYRPRRFA